MHFGGLINILYYPDMGGVPIPTPPEAYRITDDVAYFFRITDTGDIRITDP